MQWIHHYQLFLFDFDGLLVDTEVLHYQAYIDVLQEFGFDWDFPSFCMHAHYSSSRFKEAVCKEYPQLSPIWESLYAKKRERVLNLLEEGDVDLMPGAKELLETLSKERIASCVVTNSTEAFVARLRKKHPILNSITHWVTRGDYKEPKPHPECYLKAIQLYSKDNDGVIGFEDTPKGMNALLKTQATPVLITTIPYPEIAEFQRAGVLLFSSLGDIPLPVQKHPLRLN